MRVWSSHRREDQASCVAVCAASLSNPHPPPPSQIFPAQLAEAGIYGSSAARRHALAIHPAHVLTSARFAPLQAVDSNDKCVGTVVCKLGRHKKTMRLRGYIAMLVVHEDYRGRKIGRICRMPMLPSSPRDDDCHFCARLTPLTPSLPPPPSSRQARGWWSVRWRPWSRRGPRRLCSRRSPPTRQP